MRIIRLLRLFGVAVLISLVLVLIMRAVLELASEPVEADADLDPVWYAKEAPTPPEPPAKKTGEAENAWPTDCAQYAISGPTRFVRRLTAGSELISLRERFKEETDCREIARCINGLVPHFLHADRFPATRLRSTPVRRSRIGSILESLTKPRRDRERLQLTTASRGSGSVRAWTLAGSYPEFELWSAEQLLERLRNVAQQRIEGGFDVLVTPELGQEVFPKQGGAPWAAGFYCPRDEYCTVMSGIPSRLRFEVLKHELIHAFCLQFTKGLMKSRFIGEGLAEYLRLEPVGRGLSVPPSRMADNLAALQGQLEGLRAGGVHLDQLRPARLVELNAHDFYAMRGLSYLLAQAAMAYLDSRHLEAAFEIGSDRPIVEAINKIHWERFLEFVAEGAARGSTERALIVEDQLPAEGRRDAVAMRASLRKLGARFDPHASFDPEDLELDGPFQEEEQVKAMLSAAAAADKSTLYIVTEVSADMDRSIRLAADAEKLLPAVAHVRTPLEFVRSLHHAMGTGPTGLVCLGPRLTEEEQLDFVQPYRVEALFAWLHQRRAKAPGLMLCVAAAAGEDSGARLRRYRKELRALKSLPQIVLCIDLSDGEGEALTLARAFAPLPGMRDKVAYWNPQRKPAAVER
ncbi:MAG: hypothetical protein ACYSUN_02265 [Planctomycetota bacterium]|jgi:hypothetical protein